MNRCVVASPAYGSIQRRPTTARNPEIQGDARVVAHTSPAVSDADSTVRVSPKRTSLRVGSVMAASSIGDSSTRSTRVARCGRTDRNRHATSSDQTVHAMALSERSQDAWRSRIRRSEIRIDARSRAAPPPRPAHPTAVTRSKQGGRRIASEIDSACRSKVRPWRRPCDDDRRSGERRQSRHLSSHENVLSTASSPPGSSFCIVMPAPSLLTAQSNPSTCRRACP